MNNEIKAEIRGESQAEMGGAGKSGKAHFSAQFIFLPSFRQAANRSYDFIREIREIRGSILLAAGLARLAQVQPVKVAWRFINSVEYAGFWTAMACARKASVENRRLFG
jgi:hypothetical protein